VLGVDLDVVRSFLHILAATVWVGGQLTLAGLLPALRRVGGEAPREVARQFPRIAWPAFAVLVLTGVWNIAAEDEEGGAYRTTLTVKLAVVAVSGVAAYLHARARTRRGLAVWGAVTGVSALLALLLGTTLRAA
jgi:putative copper export protein